MRLVVDVAAWGDLNDIGAWIAKDSPEAARRVLRAILATIDKLPAFPRLARPGRVSGTHERRVAGTPYIIVYELQDEAIVVIAVAHGARQR